MNKKIEELVKLARERNAEGIKNKLKEVIPEYQPFDGVNKTLSPLRDVISAKSPSVCTPNLLGNMQRAVRLP